MRNKKSGSAYVIVIGVLGIVIFASTMFMSSTVHEGRQTQMSVRGLHSHALAETAVERAMSIIGREVSDYDPSTAQADDLAVLLRLPARVAGGSGLSLSGSLGLDRPLNLPANMKREFVFTKADLQPAGSTDFDDMVDFMTDGEIDDYEVEVKVSIDRAFRIAPGSDNPDYKVPGVEQTWTMRPDVRSFLDGNGYTAMVLSIPSDFTWFSLEIPVTILGVPIMPLDFTDVVSGLLPSITLFGKSYTFAEIVTIDALVSIMLNDVLGRGKTIYPFTINFDKFDIPTSVSDLWPSGVSISSSKPEEQYLEKFGQLKIESEARITYRNGYTSSRRISAVKDFKVADCEPPAPMYSLFIANENNHRLEFNNVGGTFMVNNKDYSGFFSRTREVITGSTKELSGAELESRDVPGLIRVNYQSSEHSHNPLICNVSFVGDYNAPQVKDDGSSRLMNGMETMLILNLKTEMALANAKYAVNADLHKRDSGGFSSKLSTTWGDAKPVEDPSRVKAPLSPKDTFQETYGGLTGAAAKISLLPDVAKFGCNIFEFALTMALLPLKETTVGEFLSFNKFQKWDMGYFGTRNSTYTLPTNIGVNYNKTHFFGAGGLSPTMTREIEGNVLKRHRRWNFLIVGMKSIHRLPLLPFPPYRVPPIPFPVWYTQDVLTKYGYEVGFLRSLGDDGRTDNNVYEYSPKESENMAPNLYTVEQYAKKAAYYYESYDQFLSDIPNRTTELNGQTVFLLNGVTYIAGSLGNPANPFNPTGGGVFNVVGKGMIVTSGNIFLGCDIRAFDRSADDTTVFSLIARKGGLVILDSGRQYVLECSLYTDKGIGIAGSSSLNIIGNWVTNDFSKGAMAGTVKVDYVSSRVRSSLGSLHPERGKFDPRRYHVSFSPTWSSWRAH